MTSRPNEPGRRVVENFRDPTKPGHWVQPEVQLVPTAAGLVHHPTPLRPASGEPQARLWQAIGRSNGRQTAVSDDIDTCVAKA